MGLSRARRLALATGVHGVGRKGCRGRSMPPSSTGSWPCRSIGIDVFAAYRPLHPDLFLALRPPARSASGQAAQIGRRRPDLLAVEMKVHRLRHRLPRPPASSCGRQFPRWGSRVVRGTRVASGQSWPVIRRAGTHASTCGRSSAGWRYSVFELRASRRTSSRRAAMSVCSAASARAPASPASAFSASRPTKNVARVAVT